MAKGRKINVDANGVVSTSESVEEMGGFSEVAPKTFTNMVSGGIIPINPHAYHPGIPIVPDRQIHFGPEPLPLDRPRRMERPKDCEEFVLPIMMTPDIGMVWRCGSRTVNRNWKHAKLKKFMAEMNAGLWVRTGQTISMSWDMDILDGHHRIEAGINTGKSFWTLVAFNCDPRNLGYWDAGSTRQKWDNLQMKGERFTIIMKAYLKLLWVIESGRLDMAWGHMGDDPLGFLESSLNEMLEKHPDVRAALEIHQQYYQSFKALSPTMWMFVLHYLPKCGPNKVEEFAELLSTGLTTDQYSPILHFRNAMISNTASSLKKDAKVILAMLIKTWNYWLMGKEVEAIGWNSREKYPQILSHKLHNAACKLAPAGTFDKR